VREISEFDTRQSAHGRNKRLIRGELCMLMVKNV
jgi:hypothetical protein